MMSWDAERSGASSGVFFLIARQRAGETGFTTLGGTADKFYNDLAPGVCDGIVSYQIKAMRGQLGSAWTMPVMFTLSSGGGNGVAGSISTPQGIAKAA
jgi:hypothetical protein